MEGAPSGDADVRGWRRTVRVAALAACCGSIVGIWVLALRYRHGAPQAITDVLYPVVVPVAYLVPGTVVLLRRHWHVVGWLLCLAGVTATMTLSGGWAPQALRAGDAWAVLCSQTLGEGALGWLPLIALLLVFPDGFAAQTPRQRRTGRAVLAVAGTVGVVELFVREVGLGGVPGLLPNPLPFSVVPRAVVPVTGSIAILALPVAFVGLLVRNRSAGPVERRQYRWVLLAIALLVGGLAFGLVASAIAPADGGAWWAPLLLSLLFLPIAFTVAILRYRLFEIDRVVSRTVGYTVVVVLLGAAYAAVVTLLTALLPSAGDVAVAGSTLAVAAASAPLRRTVQRAVDHRFNRPRFDAEREVERFARALRDQTDLGLIESELAGAVARALQPSAMLLWIPRPPTGGR